MEMLNCFNAKKWYDSSHNFTMFSFIPPPFKITIFALNPNIYLPPGCPDNDFWNKCLKPGAACLNKPYLDICEVICHSRRWLIKQQILQQIVYTTHCSAYTNTTYTAVHVATHDTHRPPSKSATGEIYSREEKSSLKTQGWNYNHINFGWLKWSAGV